jgi:hypothetical protein
VPLEDVVAWLTSAYPNYGVNVCEIAIPCTPQPQQRALKRFADFKAAFRGKDSRQHGWLKWFAFNWLLPGSEYEVDLFLPDALGRSTANYRGRVLSRGHQYGSRIGWGFQRADVVSFERLVEVGVTSPRSLVAPLWSYAVREVVWLPFQRDDIHAEWQDFTRMNAAFRITRSPCGAV